MDAPSTERFSHLAENYAKHRPTYPAAAIDWMVARILPPLGGKGTGLVADLGAGTGISTRLLAERGILAIGGFLVAFIASIALFVVAFRVSIGWFACRCSDFRYGPCLLQPHRCDGRTGVCFRKRSKGRFSFSRL
jgi:hypothetical protein